MTDAERRAFERGFAYGAEAMVDAHDGLVPIVTRYVAPLQAVGARLGDVEDDEVRIVMARVRRVRFEGVADALLMFEVERALEAMR
jgi:hypothetical protein